MLKVKVLPANCGDCIIISFKDKDKIRNILVDGGVGRVYKKILRNEIEKIKEKNQQIDLLIITHIDADHIGGIIKFVEDDENNNIIKKVWFNSWENIVKKPVRLSHNENNISPRQARTLENKLKKLGVWSDEVIMQGSHETYSNAKITVISPNQNELDNLKFYIKDEFEISEEDDRNKSISALQNRRFIEDDKIPNGSSIAFLFEYNYEPNKVKRILLLGDSFPSVVVGNLEKYRVENKKIKIDYTKLSHHASKSNTSDELIEMIECENYIVTTMGCHGNPNKETFARILKNHSKVNLFFNYKNEQTEKIFLPEESEHIKSYFLSENKEKYVIEVC